MEFSSADVERIRSGNFVREIEVHSEIGSTNDRAAERALEPSLPCPCLILTARQTAGRGRGANAWWSAPGALTFSLVLEPWRIGLVNERLSQVALASGLAVCEVIGELLPRSPVGLKWPNDVFLSGRKVSGILIEAPSSGCGRLVAGIGLNVNNGFAIAPDELRRTAVSMIDIAGQPFDRTAVLLAVLDRLDTWLRVLAADERAVFKRWRRYCILTGKRVRLRAGDRDVEGLCCGIDDDGRLLLSTPQGTEPHRSGTVVSFE